MWPLRLLVIGAAAARVAIAADALSAPLEVAPPLRMQGGSSAIESAARVAKAPAELGGHATKPEFDMSGLVGAEYTPWRAANSLWWHQYSQYRGDVVREVKAMREVFGFTALRVFLHDLLWDADSAGLKRSIDDFLSILDAQGMKAGLVFFDDCWQHTGADLESTCEPRQGVHNGCWFAAPQDNKRTAVDQFEGYVSGIVSAFKSDKRVAWFEIFNEPQKGSAFSFALRDAGFKWAKAQQPIPPVISCWDDNNDTDVVDKHWYSDGWQDSGIFDNPAKGGIITEAGCRWFQQDKDHGSPLTLVNWLNATKRGGPGAGSFVPGVMISWEVMVGRSMTRWGWLSREGDAEPAIPWCGSLYPDLSPVSYTEAAAWRRYLGLPDDFLYFQNFMLPAPSSKEDYLTMEDGTDTIFWQPSSGGIGALFELSVWAETGSGSFELTAGGYKVTIAVTEEPQMCTPGPYLGCFAEPGRKTGGVLPVFAPTGERLHMTVDVCATLCKDKNFTPYPAFGLERARLCVCGPLPDPGKLLRNESLCMIPCSGNKSQTCGGSPPPAGHGDAVSVYAVSCDRKPAPVVLVSEARDGGAVLASKPVGDRLLGGAWNLIRVLAEPRRVRVWLNPTFTDIVGSSTGASATPKPASPLIDIDASREEGSPGMRVKSTGGGWLIDYVAVLPPSLFGLGSESSTVSSTFVV